MGAVTITNPLEVIKTRVQLQGQIPGRTPYKNMFHAMYLMAKTEGVLSLQKGLGVAYVYQILLNGVRVGNYEVCKQSLNGCLYPNDDPATNKHMAVNIATGGITGAIGAAVSSPAYLVKTRMQSYATGSAATTVGGQSNYLSLYQGLRTIYTQEGGIRALFRGAGSAVIRTFAGSVIQLPLYNWTKEFLTKNFGLENSPTLYLQAAGITGIGVGLVLNPFDVVLTRIYNEKKGVYSGPVDCAIKTVKNEGLTALLFKGLAPSMMRMGPHTVLVLMLMEVTMPWMKRAENWVDRQKVFSS